MTLKEINECNRYSRLFTLAVGSTPNKHLLHRASRIGNGYSEEFIKTAKSKWEGKVKRLIDRAFQPSLGGISVEWVNHDDVSYLKSKIYQLNLIIQLNLKLSIKNASWMTDL